MKKMIQVTQISAFVLLGVTLLVWLLQMDTVPAGSALEIVATPEFRPISDIYTTTPPTIINITHNSAMLDFESSIPVACSLVFGETSNYGMIASDPNMNGAAIIQHNPIMGGLLPDTTYVYRVQGTDANGIIYVGEEGSFQTLSDPTTDERNVAAAANGATVLAVSSSFGGTWAGESAIDENPATAWSSSGDGDGAFIEINLSEPSLPHAIEVWSRYMANGTAQIFTFTVSADNGQTWGPFNLPELSPPTQPHRFDIVVDSPISTMRLDVVASNGGNTGLTEFAIYAPEAIPTANSGVRVRIGR